MLAWLVWLHMSVGNGICCGCRIAHNSRLVNCYKCVQPWSTHLAWCEYMCWWIQMFVFIVWRESLSSNCLTCWPPFTAQGGRELWTPFWQQHRVFRATYYEGSELSFGANDIQWDDSRHKIWIARLSPANLSFQLEWFAYIDQTPALVLLRWVRVA